VAARTAIGLDIGTSGVRAAELVLGKGQVTLAKFGQVALPDGAVRDGEVIDVNAVAAALRELWEHTKFSSKKVTVGVANSKVVVRQVDLPAMPLDELKASLGYQVADYVPMPVEQAVLDFTPLEDVVAADGTRMVRGLLVAASREMVSRSVEAVQLAGLVPSVVDLSSFAVLRSLASGEPTPGSPVEALVDIGARVTNIVVHEGGVPRFIRILLLGGSDLTEAVAERMGVPREQAEAVKQQIGLTGAADAGMDRQAAARVLEAAANTFVDEIRGSLDYFAASSPTAPISRIVVTGGGSRLSGLAERIQAATRLPVTTGSAFDAIDVGDTGLTPEQIRFVEPLAVVPVGLALGAAS
jgi:type IV pilus assembly protein PilM